METGDFTLQVGPISSYSWSENMKNSLANLDPVYMEWGTPV